MAWTTTAKGRAINRSYSLYADGYDAREVVSGIIEVVSPEGKRYGVDVERGGVCECECYQRNGWCKHEFGAAALLRKSNLRREQEANVAKYAARAEARRFAAMAGARERKAAA